MLYAVSRIPTNNTPLSVYSTHSLPNKTPLSSRAQPRGWKSPRGTSTKPTPGQHPAVGHTRTHPYRIYRAPVRLWRGCTEPCFCLRLLSSSLSRSRSRRLSRWRQRFISSTAKQRKSESLSASLVSSLSLSSCSLSSCVSSLACQGGERGRARSRRSPPRFVWLSLIQLRGPD